MRIPTGIAVCFLIVKTYLFLYCKNMYKIIKMWPNLFIFLLWSSFNFVIGILLNLLQFIDKFTWFINLLIQYLWLEGCVNFSHSLKAGVVEYSLKPLLFYIICRILMKLCLMYTKIPKEHFKIKMIPPVAASAHA